MCIRLLKTLKFLALVALPFTSYGVGGCTFAMGPFVFMESTCRLCSNPRQGKHSLCKRCLNIDSIQKRNIKAGKVWPLPPPEDLEGEIWVPIPGFESYYHASSEGRIKFLSRIIPHPNGNLSMPEKLISPGNLNGYQKVNFQVKNVSKSLLVHRLVCAAFHENPENKPFVNHINGIKWDCRAVNLEWATAAENAAHARYILGVMTNGESKQVVHKTENGIVKYPSIADAVRETGIKRYNIQQSEDFEIISLS